MKSRTDSVWWATHSIVFVVLVAAASCGVRMAFAAAEGMTLDAVVARVLAGHPEVELGKQQVLDSEGRVKRAKEPFDWRVFANAGYQRKVVPEARNDFLTTDTETNHVLGGTAGVSKQFENGVIVSPGYSFFYNTAGDSTEALTGTRSEPKLKISVPLLRVGRENPSASNLKAARIGLGAAQLDLGWKTQQTVERAVVAFWDALAARGRLDILAKLKAQTDEVDSYLKALLDRGQLALSAYQRAAANRLYRTLDVENARADYEKAKAALATSVGLDPSVPGDYPEPEGQFPVAEQPAQENEGGDQPYVDFALEARPDLLALTSRSRAEVARLTGARNNTSPNVDLNLALDEVMVRYVMSLGNNGAEGRLLERKAAAGEARLNVDMLRRRIVNQVKQALRQLRLSERAYHTAAEANRLLEMVATDMDRRTKMGVATPQDRLATLERVADAQQRFVRAARDYAASIAELRLMTSIIPIETAGETSDVSRVFVERPEIDDRPPPSPPKRVTPSTPPQVTK